MIENPICHGVYVSPKNAMLLTYKQDCVGPADPYAIDMYPFSLSSNRLFGSSSNIISSFRSRNLLS